MKFLLLSSLLTLLRLISAATLEYNWNLTWSFLAPDGFGRPIITVNGEWPAPAIEGTVGDRVVVNVYNDLGNETATIHWHGMMLVGQNPMDGPAGVTQCPIPPGQAVTYDYTVNQTGTYWWHSHSVGQTSDGLRGPMVFHDPDAPYRNQVETPDREIILTLGDWYHTQAPYLIQYYASAENAENGGPEPIPDTGLINDAQNSVFHVQPNTTYLLRVANVGSFVGTYLEIDDHQLTIVEADGVNVDPVTVDRLMLSVAQRYAVLVTTKPAPANGAGYLIRAQLDTSMFDYLPDNYNPNFYAYLICDDDDDDDEQPFPAQTPITNVSVIDDLTLLTSEYNPYVDQIDAYTTVDHQIIWTIDFTNINSQNRGIVNNVTYIPQLVPTLYTALTTGTYASDPAVYATNVNPYIINSGEVVEVIINNHDSGSHPWHTHGYNFQLIARNEAGGGDAAGDAAEATVSPPSARPLRRDTASVNAGGFLAVRFRADNPGVHLTHCHIEWHVQAGLTATLLESPRSLQNATAVPPDFLALCARQGVPTAGNAVGDTARPLDLAGAITLPPPNPAGALLNSSMLAAGTTPSKAGALWPAVGRHHTG